MTTKYNFIFSFLLAVPLIYSCGNAGNKKDKTDTVKDLKTNQKNQKNIKSSITIGGTYSFGDNVEEEPAGSVIVYPLTDNTALFYLDVCQGSPGYGLGQLFGKMTIKDNIGTFDSKDDQDYFNCILKFKFSSGQLEVLLDSENVECGFGGHVSVDNRYYLTDKNLPKYFIAGEGDTIAFKGLTVEKYKNLYE
jgi:hypothetical protein